MEAAGMKTEKYYRTEQQGSALIAVLVIALIVAFAAGSLGTMLRSSAHTNRIIVNRVKARQIADGAAQQALALIADDFDRVSTPTSEMTSGSLGDGTYEVDIQDLGNNTAVILADGTVGNRTERVKVFFRFPQSGAAFDKGVFANDDFTGSGGGSLGTLDHGSHSNQDTYLKGHVTVRGDADSVGSTTVRGAATVNGVVRSGVSPIDFPAVDFDHYYNIASANGEVYTPNGGTLQMKNQTYSPDGGVMWVVGDVKISGHTTINGALFVTGDIKQAGQCELNKAGALPAFVSRDGDIHLSGHGASIEGLVYAASGRIDVTGYHRIYGALVAWGEVFTRGNWGVLDFVRENPEMEGANAVEILAWE